MGGTSVQRVGIVGSGIMGGGLAEVAATAGMDVVVRSRTQQAADALVSDLAKRLDRQVDKGKLEPADRDAVLGRVQPTHHIGDLVECDLVIESVVEDLTVKQALFAELDSVVKPAAILATNTSTLPVVELAARTERPDKVCGIHFFNPAPLMALVEIVRPLTASDDTIAEAIAFSETCGKQPIEVADRAGFVVNALLFPYLNHAVRLLEQGTASMEAIDTAMQGGCNFPMGPFKLLDLVGLDTSISILEALHAESGDAFVVPAPTLRRLVAAGRLGRKSGRGFYDYAG